MSNPFPNTTGDTPVAAPNDAADLEALVIEAIRQVYDPEIPVNVYDLGLIYDLEFDAENAVAVRMTLTAPACPVAGTLPGEVVRAVNTVPGVSADGCVSTVSDFAQPPRAMAVAANRMLVARRIMWSSRLHGFGAARRPLP